MKSLLVLIITISQIQAPEKPIPGNPLHRPLTKMEFYPMPTIQDCRGAEKSIIRETRLKTVMVKTEAYCYE